MKASIDDEKAGRKMTAVYLESYDKKNRDLLQA